MRTRRRGWLAFFLSCFLSIAWANSAPPVWFSKQADNQISLRVDLFLTSTCPHCQEADRYFKRIEPKTPWIQVNRHVINQDKVALETFGQFLKAQKMPEFMVPAIFFCNTRWVGFFDADKSGTALLKGLNYCREAIKKTGELTPATQRMLTQMSFETSVRNNPSLVWFLPLMAISDAMSYTVLFSILALFAFLMIQKNRSDRILTLVLFLSGTGIAHHGHQVHTIFSWEAMPVLRWPVAVLGLALIAFVVLHYRGLVKKQKLARLLSLLMVFPTAFVLQLYQQNLLPVAQPDYSVIFQQWLLDKNYTFVQQFASELMYQVVYLGIIALFSLGLRALFRYNKRLKKYSCFVAVFGWMYLVIVGLILIFSPVLLSEGSFAFVCIILTSVATWSVFKLGLK